MKGVDWLSPRPLFLIIVLLGVYIPSYAFLRYEDWFSKVWPFLFFNKDLTTLKVMGIYAAIAAVFVLAHRRAVRKPYKGALRPLRNDTFHRYNLALIGTGVGAIVIILTFVGGIEGLLEGASDRTRAFAGIQGLFLLLNTLASAVIVWVLRLTSQKTLLSEKLTFLGFLLFALFILALQGQKSTLFILIAATGIIFHTRVRRFTLPEILIGTFILYCGLMSYHIYKQEYLVLGRVVSLSSGGQFWDTFTEFLNQQFFGNFMQLQTMSVLVEGMPIPLQYQYGATYWAGLTLLIPRSLYPDKPLPSTGTFTEAFWPDAWRATGTTLPAGVFGEGYMNFGIAGALLIAWIAGTSYGRFESRRKNDPTDDFGLAIYAVMIAAMLHYFRGEFASVTYTALSILLPCIIVTRRLKSAK
jgi:oligosaccharide repeat unit polymerase